MWTELHNSLREEWSLDYCAWLLETAPVFAAAPAVGEKGTPAQSILHAVDRFHSRSPKVGRLCLSLTCIPDPKTLALVERVAKENPEEKVQGQAAMAIA
ncbi:MAG: hypothetical protein GWO24_06290, partial [Akkermansiaceae bacterium]|nr:hypothetical protein [Akkermansiaceae bacterium]